MSTSIVTVLAACALALLGGAAVAEPDPPARVGRASLVVGDVAYLRDGEWVPLPVNWPVTTGTRLSAAPGARAELRIGSTAVRLAGATEVEVARLDDDAIALRLLNGTIDARVRSAEIARELWVETAEARITLLEPGRYRFDTGLAPGTTAVSADFGAARVEAGANAVVVRAGKRAEVGRNGDIRLADARPDAFDEWALALDRRAEAARSARYVSPEMTGYESLDEHGDWREVPEYGPVWVPRAVPIGWAPYRTGRWAWIAPWGWTWIDEAPWGFAPFHYGRWAFVGGIWGWAPGRVVARPVYAPALVGWVGRPGWSVSVSIGTVPAVGWFPLAPREVYVPAHRHSPAYVRNVNVAHVTNVTQITNVTSVNYANRRIERAVTVVPAAAVTNGQPVARSQVHVRQAELDRRAHASPTPPVTAAAPPRPEAQSTEARGVHRRFEPADRSPTVRRDERRPEISPQPLPQVQATPATPSRAVEARPEPRREQQTTPRASTPAATTPPPAQAQSRAEPRAIPSQPEPRREATRVEVPRPPVPQVQASPRNEPRPNDSRPEPRPEPRREAQRVEAPRAAAPSTPMPPQQHAYPRAEPRQETRRAEPPRVAAPTTPAPPPAQPRVETRPAPQMPVVRAPPSAPPPAAMPVPQPHQPQSGPRDERERGQGREQRRHESGKTG